MGKFKISTFGQGLIWFGAAVSLAEILTGTLIAPLGFKKGLIAILLGHFIGCILFYLSGFIGAKTGLSSMDNVKISFGKKGALLFSSLNALQLIGWTAVMIISGAIAANNLFSFGSSKIWAIIISILIIIWVLVDIDKLSKLNTVSMIMLFALTLLLSFVVFNKCFFFV